MRPGLREWENLRLAAKAADRAKAAETLTSERLHALYPEADEFIAARRRLDPDGRFLNDHLRPLFE
jgi:FAD/FMN-containing dehydrogenase